MLHRHINQFLDYCSLVDFSIRSIQALTTRLNEFDIFSKTQRIRSIKRVRYRSLIDFAADFNAPSIHVTKSRVWALRQFYHFLTLHRIVPENIATGLPYPKIEKTLPQFLTEEEYTRLLRYFTDRTSSPFGMRNLIIIMLLGTLGLRTSTLTALNIEDIDLTCGLLYIREKGRRHRSVILSHCICKIIRNYLYPQRRKKGPLLISKRKKRISPRTLQDIFRTAADHLGIDKKLHVRLFRHTAATHLNKVAGIEITQQVLGHSRRANTLRGDRVDRGSGQANILIFIFFQSKTIGFVLLYRSFRCRKYPYTRTGTLEVRGFAPSFELDGRSQSYTSAFFVDMV